MDDEGLKNNPQNNNESGGSKFIKCLGAFKKKYVFGLIFNVLNLLLTVSCIVIYIYTTYYPGLVLRNSNAFFIFNFGSRCFFFLDFLLEAFSYNLELLFKFYTNLLVETLSTVPYLISRITVGMKEDLISNTHMICSALVCLRIFRILNFSRYIRSDVNRELYNIMCSIFSLVITASSLINVIENTQTIGKYWLFLPRDCDDRYNCDGNNDSFHSSFFFIMTTLATIGYYSTITSIPGRCFIIGLILISIIEIPSLCSNLMMQLSSKSVYARTAYKRLDKVEFVLISGNISFGSLNVLLQEYFHPDHGENERHAVILLPQRPDSSMKSLLQEYNNKLFYYEGDPMKINDLQRCQFKNASMIMLLCNKQTDNSSAEDSKTIMQAMAIKKYFSQDKEEDEEHQKKISAVKSNTVKSEENIELTTQKNLLRTLEDNNNTKSMNAGDKNEHKELKEPRLIIQLLRPESEHHFSLSISKNSTTDQILCIDELKLSFLAKSCLCRGIISLLSNLIITNSSDDSEGEKEKTWMDEYKHGKNYEIYKISLEYLRGYKFSTCAEKIYNEKQIILFGLNIESKADNMNIVLLSPMDFVLPLERDVNVYGYLLAKDQGDADNVTAWAKTQKRMQINLYKRTSEDFPEMTKGIRKFTKRLSEEELNFEPDSNSKDKDVYSTDALTFAKICHVTKEHISKTSVTLESVDGLVIAREHIIICGICQNLIDFIKPLRAKYLPRTEIPPIVILSQELPDDKVWNSISFFEQIYLIQGDPLRKSDLKRAGIKSAKSVVILAPSVQEISEFTMSEKIKNLKNKESLDDSNIISGAARKLTQEEENLLDTKTVLKYNLVSSIRRNIFCIVDLINPNNVIFLNNHGRQNNDEYQFIQAGLNIDSTVSFASGEVYYSSIMDNIISQAYYNQSLLKVLKKLIVGEETNTFIKQSVLSRYSNVISGNLFLIELPLRALSDTALREQYVKFSEVFKILLSKKILVIGVYRCGEISDNVNNITMNDRMSNQRKKNPFYYVVTSPEDNFEVALNDKLFVISQEFPHGDIFGDEEQEDVKDEDYLSSNDQGGGTKLYSKKVDHKKELKKEMDGETEEKMEAFKEKFSVIAQLMDDIEKCIKKYNSDREKMIAEKVKKKISAIFKGNTTKDTNPNNEQNAT